MLDEIDSLQLIYVIDFSHLRSVIDFNGIITDIRSIAIYTT